MWVVGISFKILFSRLFFVCKIDINVSFLFLIWGVFILYSGVWICLVFMGSLCVILYVSSNEILCSNWWKFLVEVLILCIRVSLCCINGWLIMVI